MTGDLLTDADVSRDAIVHLDELDAAHRFPCIHRFVNDGPKVSAQRRLMEIIALSV